MKKIATALSLFLALGCANMTISQKEMVKEIAGIAIGMTVEALIDRLGEPEGRSLSRDMEVSAESLVYPGRIFWAKNGVIYAVYGVDGAD